MLLITCSILAKEYTEPISNDHATISFDEGPSDNIVPLVEILKQHGISATFHLSPKRIDKALIDLLKSNGHDIGLYAEELPGDYDEFIKNSGFEPKLCRLPYYGYDEENVEQAEQLGMIVTRPNLDSEDNEIEDWISLFTGFVDQSNKGLSVVFRERFDKTMRNIENAMVALQKKYEIVDIHAFYGITSIAKNHPESSCSTNNKASCSASGCSITASNICASQDCSGEAMASTSQNLSRDRPNDEVISIERSEDVSEPEDSIETGQSDKDEKLNASSKSKLASESSYEKSDFAAQQKKKVSFDKEISDYAEKLLNIVDIDNADDQDVKNIISDTINAKNHISVIMDLKADEKLAKAQDILVDIENEPTDDLPQSPALSASSDFENPSAASEVIIDRLKDLLDDADVVKQSVADSNKKILAETNASTNRIRNRFNKSEKEAQSDSNEDKNEGKNDKEKKNANQAKSGSKGLLTLLFAPLLILVIL